MKIILSKHAGFCPGVRQAVEIATGAAETEKVFTWGPLVHNREMLAYLEKTGVKPITQVPDKGVVVIRSHGIGRRQRAELEASGCRLLDATCPHVARIHNVVRELPPETHLVVVGDRDHPEVEGIVGWAQGRVSIINNSEEAETLEVEALSTAVVQTTFNRGRAEEILSLLQQKHPDMEIFKTICPATELRQQEAAELSRKAQLMLVIGGKNSANTAKLVEVCRQSGVNTHHIETAKDIDPGWFNGVESVGITSGASTPDWIIREVVDMVTETKNEEMGEEKKEETQETPEQETPEQETPEQETLEQETPEQETPEQETLEQETKPLAVGDIVAGTVVQVNPEEVLVDVGYKMEGIIRKEELSFRKVEQCSDLVSNGDSLEAEVIRLSEDSLELSVRRAAQDKAWQEVREAFDNQLPLTGKVVEEVKGGLIVDLGLRGFMPASLVDLRFVEDLGQFVDQEITVMVIELERRRNKVIVSRKAYLMQQVEEDKKKTLETLEEGNTVKGIVRRLTSFGAFVDVGGIDGLVHISELAHHRVEHPSEVLSEDQEVEVYVLKVDPEAERVSLSIKHLLPDPWSTVGQKFKTGEVVEGKVVRLADFGAFVELIPGVDGLVHVSQIAEDHVEKPSDVLSVGQVVKVKILDIDTKGKRVSLSIRETESRPRRQSRDEDGDDGGSIGVSIGERLGSLFAGEKSVPEAEAEASEEPVEQPATEPATEEEPPAEPEAEAPEEPVEEEPAEKPAEPEPKKEKPAKKTRKKAAAAKKPAETSEEEEKEKEDTDDSEESKDGDE